MTGLESLIEADTKHHSQHSVAITTGIGQCVTSGSYERCEAARPISSCLR